jgi:hypothetical protein
MTIVEAVAKVDAVTLELGVQQVEPSQVQRSYNAAPGVPLARGPMVKISSRRSSARRRRLTTAT